MKVLHRTIAVGLLALFAGTAVAQEEAPGIPFSLPLPEGWKSETIGLPPDFAPDMTIEGFEVLRFSPGMFRDTADDFWTYAFVWWIPGAANLDPTSLEGELSRYFEGLAKVVAEAGEFEAGDVSVAVEIREAEAGTPYRLEGEMEVFDAFITRERIALNVRVAVRECADQAYHALIFEFSPQALSHDVWKAFGTIRDGFSCEAEKHDAE